jgi:hypothetical protein
MSSAQDARASAEGSGQAQRTAPPRPRKSFLVPIVIIVAIILIVAALAIAFVFVASKKDNSTPEDAFRDYVRAILDSDFASAYNETIYSLGGTTFAEWSYDMQPLPSGTQITINSIDQIGNESMSDEQRYRVSWMIGLIEDNLNVDVVDFCWLEFNLTITGGISDSSVSEVACVKVDSSWYLVEPEDWLYDWSPDVPAVAMTKTPIVNGYRFTLIPSESFSWSDMTVFLGPYALSWEPVTANLNGTGVMTQACTPELLGNSLVYLNATDLGGNGVVNAGDFFTLEIAGGFPPGTMFTVQLYFEPRYVYIGEMAFTT